MCQRFEEYHRCMVCKAVYWRTWPTSLYGCPQASARRRPCRTPLAIPPLVHWDLSCNSCADAQKARELLAQRKYRMQPLIFNYFDDEWEAIW